MPLLLGLLVAPAVLSGCGGGTVHQQSASSSGTISQSSAAAGSTADGATDAPPFPADAEPDTSDASSGARVTVSGIRMARQDGFDRVVFEVGGSGTPGWDVRYVAAAASEGSGKPIHVGGNAILRVALTGAGYPYDTGVTEYSAAAPLTASGTANVTDLVYDATYEGTATAFVGAQKKAPFRVYLLQNPTRVVLDVADGS